ncbi:MAG: hypothetical protein E7358_03340 [Clostridiales bacterium]|nr:hypothetical protein [Clostridiales bacterium]
MMEIGIAILGIGIFAAFLIPCFYALKSTINSEKKAKEEKKRISSLSTTEALKELWKAELDLYSYSWRYCRSCHKENVHVKEYSSSSIIVTDWILESSDSEKGDTYRCPHCGFKLTIKQIDKRKFI